jgi:hypothetical protein
MRWNLPVRAKNFFTHIHDKIIQQHDKIIQQRRPGFFKTWLIINHDSAVTKAGTILYLMILFL